MKGSSSKVLKTEKEFGGKIKTIRLVTNMKASIREIRNTDMENSYGKAEAATKASTKQMSDRARAEWNSVMALFTKETG